MSAGPGPSVSVVISAYNEEERLPACLASLARQTLHPTEIVLVDDGSRDRTARIAEEAGARVLGIPHSGVGAARDAGGRAAVGDIVVFLDGDEVYADDFLERLVAPLSDPAVTGTFPGTVEWEQPVGRLARAWLTIFGYSADAPIRREPEHPYPKALRRRDFLRAGGYPHVGYGEDFAFGERTGPALVVFEARYVFSLPVGTREIFAKSRWIGRGPGFERVRPPLWCLVPPFLFARTLRRLKRRQPVEAYVRLLYDLGTALGYFESRLRPKLKNVA